MENNKLINKNLIENFFLIFIIVSIIINGIIHSDSVVAVISAVCGITYTFIAGKGYPACYLFGLTGSFFYCYLAFTNALWGNLLLYGCYYIPMQTIGFIHWNKNLKEDKKGIVKRNLKAKEFSAILLLSSLLSIILYVILVKINDAHPILDSITTVLSIAGMYLTVKRAIEQWIIWMFVNILSLFMWINVALSGARVYSTIAMWGIYSILAVYFYIIWKKELNIKK